MKAVYFLVALTGVISTSAQKDFMRTIEVTGEYTIDLIPDEIAFTISLEEYWEEEFQEGKEHKDYRTKVSITTIEDALMRELSQAEITMDMISLQQTGNYWRQRGKDFLISKSLNIRLTTFEKANELSNILMTRGIRNMTVSDMKYHDMEQEQIHAKIEALKVAKSKAKLLAGAVDKTIKDVVTIVEVDQYVGAAPRSYANKESAMLMRSNGGGASYENFKKIKVKAVVRVVFELQ